jgi:hypothetical protein
MIHIYKNSRANRQQKFMAIHIRIFFFFFQLRHTINYRVRLKISRATQPSLFSSNESMPF